MSMHTGAAISCKRRAKGLRSHAAIIDNTPCAWPESLSTRV